MGLTYVQFVIFYSQTKQNRRLLTHHKILKIRFIVLNGERVMAGVVQALNVTGPINPYSLVFGIERMVGKGVGSAKMKPIGSKMEHRQIF